MAPTRMTSPPLLVPRTLVSQLLHLYDYPDPRRPGRLIKGYDCPHALRTARMCAAVAQRMGHPPARATQYQIACILHDLGRAGLDRRLFGRIWSWARAQGIPTRPREWRALHPETRYGRETEAFVSRYRSAMEAAGIELNAWACEQVEMRLGYARRLAARLRAVKPRLRELAVTWSPWMSRIMLYYYYPEKLKGAQPWVRELAEILVACEQFEAYSNQRRGRDYYVRQREDVSEAFAYLDALQGEGIISRPVVQALRALAAEGVFDRVLEEARGRSLSRRERTFLRRAGQESLHAG
ncbi:MAG: HD domain-containing protein [Nitrospira sp.]|nr:HD domain-containing protein [Nitrospira sp.]